MAAYAPKTHANSPKEIQIAKTIQEIQHGFKVLVLMRGLPGSGKSTLAKDIVKQGVSSTDYKTFIHSTDDYFVHPKTGKYNFQFQKLGEAHANNQRKANDSMAKGISPVIIDNTNIQLWEMISYAQMAMKYNYIVEIIEPYTKWAFKVNELALRNSHGVPIDKLQQMLDQYDKTITVEKLLKSIGVLQQNAPTYRLLPPLFCVPSNDDEQQIQTAEACGSPNIKQTTPESTFKNASDYTNLPNQTLVPTKLPAETHNVYPELNLSSWGLSENAVSSWESWEMVNPIKCDKNSENDIVETKDEAKKLYLNTSTNTQSSDLINGDESVGIKILNTNNRDINAKRSASPYDFSPPKRTLLHKSSMTDDIFTLTDDDNAADQQVLHLASLFPNIPMEYLKDVFEKCRGDVNWAVDILLDDNKEILPLPVQSSSNVLSNTLQNLQIGSDTPANTAASTSNDVLVEYVVLDQTSFPNCHAEPFVPIEKPSTSAEPNHLTDSDSDSESDVSNSDEQTIEINLGQDIVSQLESKLGFEEVMPKDFLPIVQLPIELARQLYAIYAESVFEQMEAQNNALETIVKQDEEFALKLHQQEESLQKTNVQTVSLREIMNEQAAANAYQREIDSWKNETPTDLATKMSLQKLYSSFPRLDPLIIREIYHAYNNSYNDTVEVLLASSNSSFVNDPEGIVKEVPVTETDAVEMKEAQVELADSMDVPDIVKTAQEYRDEANYHFEKHSELIQKAIQYYQKKQYLVAAFYSDVAKTHTRLYDQANNLAASAFLNEHSKKLQNFYTLDLHFLYVREAVSAMDIFIDKNIQLLNERKQSENLFIITGRGKRSEHGRSKLKPVIMSRLRKRKIRYWEVNPGLIKIRIMYTSSLTSDVM